MENQKKTKSEIEVLSEGLKDSEKLKKDLNQPINRLQKLEKELKECQREKAEFLKGWQRSRADFLNYKKEEAERIKEFLEYGNESLILEILPILDSFEEASRLNFLPENLEEQEKEKINQIIQGFLQIKKQLEDFLKGQGLQRIEVLEKQFDPNFHEALEQVEIRDKSPGTIIEEVQAGYMYKGRLLRPARVKVAR